MTDVTPSVTLHPDATVTFFDEHRPDLTSGRLVVRATQTFDAATAGGAGPYVAEARLEVAGPRFLLGPADVLAVYPPPGSRGKFHETLPHVVLQSSTLPWTRTAQDVPGGDSPPWLALVLVPGDDSDVSVTSRTVAQTVSDFGLPGEHGDAAVQSVVVLEVPVNTLAPTATDLARRGRLLNHVRVTSPPGEARSERAVVLSSHLPPEAKRVVAHLVSIEHLLVRAGSTWTWRPGIEQDSTVGLVSLHSWDFFCQAEEAHSFTEYVTNLAVGMLAPDRNGANTSGDADANGFALVDHQLRDGTTAASWYHGPLSPGPAPLSPNQLSVDGEQLLPARRADELLLFDEGTGRLDVSYAAAWEIGRLIALSDSDVATSLDGWKRALRHADRTADMRSKHAHLSQSLPPSAPPPEFGLDGWFRSKVNALGAVPFRYLVADETAMPAESFRFFEVDPLWVACLRDGAFSIGRADNGDRDVALLAALTTDGTPTAGFLLRSDLIDAYPGTLIDAYSAAHDDPLDHTDHIDPISITRLGPQVVLALYPRMVHTVILHLHPETLHHGLQDGEPRWPGDVVPDAALDLGSAEFALERVVKAPHHRFVWSAR